MTQIIAGAPENGIITKNYAESATTEENHVVINY